MTDAPTTDYPAAAHAVATALAHLDENGDFDSARDSDPFWPAAAEGAAVRALRDLRDALNRRTTAMPALDRAVMIASRRGRNFAPEQLTVTLHTPDKSVAVEGHPHGPQTPAPEFPEFPELHLPTYTFPEPLSGNCDATDLETFLAAFAEALEQESARPDGRLLLTVHADVPGYDFDDAYAWRHDPDTETWVAVPPADAADLFHDDTQVLTYPWGKAPFSSVSALTPTNSARDVTTE